jgi:hypothetical protein
MSIGASVAVASLGALRERSAVRSCVNHRRAERGG